MPGGRRTHDYPHGKPSALVLVEVATAVVGIAWMALFSFGWAYRIFIVAAFLALAIVASKLTKTYERTGLAMRIPRVVAVSYPSGLPSLLWWLRMGFFAAVALMLLFGLAPLPPKMAQTGMIACVLGLFLVGIGHLIAERHFANTGRAIDEYDGAEK